MVVSIDWGSFFVGVLFIRALSFGVHIGPPIFGNFPTAPKSRCGLHAIYIYINRGPKELPMSSS